MFKTFVSLLSGHASYFLLCFCIQPEDGFYSRNMLLMITYKQSCV